VKGFEEGKKGKITFRTPIFSLAEVSPETEAKAIECDKVLQEFLASYFSRTKTQQVRPPAEQEEEIPLPDVKDAREEDLEDIPPLSKQILNLLLEANEIRLLLGFWTFVNILVLAILIYVAFRK
jgi:hypothetical protein